MKRTALLIALFTATAALADEPLRVVTSIETFADLARRVGGDKVTVETLSHGYQDPHFVEARPNLMVTLSRADLLVRVGMDLEIGWLPPLVLGSRNDRIQRGAAGDLDCSQFIEALDVPATKIDRSLGDIHPAGNPHYWIPPVNAVRIAKGIAGRLAQLRPADRAYFDAQLRAFAEELKRRAPEWEARARKLSGMKVVTYHQSWTYVAKWLGLDVIGYVENRPGIAPSPDHLAALISAMREQKASRVIVESFYNRSIADMVGEKAGASVVSAPSDVGAKPDIKTYFDLVDALLTDLTR